jgi:hypothetical protein
VGRVLTNNIGLNYNIETSLGVAGTEWFQLEPNTISALGATITTVARDPISQNRQRRKGTVTDLDSTVEFDADLTRSAFRDFVEGFVFSVSENRFVNDLASIGAETATDTFIGLTALTAAQAQRFGVSSLIWVEGGASATNQGLHPISSAAAATNTALSVGTNLVDETASLTIFFAGYRIPAADAVTWAYDSVSGTATLSVTGLGTILTNLGVFPGEIIHIGSIRSAGGAIQNAFDDTGTDDAYGYVRVRSIATDVITLDKIGPRLQVASLADPGDLDLVFSEFIRNVPVSNADFLERSFQFEAAFPNLGDGTAGNTDEAYQYALGNYCNTKALNMPLTDKATMTFGFIGTDTENPTTTRKTGADSAALPSDVTAFNTSTDFARLRIQDTDFDGLTTDFKSMTLTLNNNVTPEKILARLGAAFINFGNFEVNLESQLIFSNPLVVNRIRDNTTVTMDFVLRNDNGVIAIDIPSMTLGGGDREYPVNETVLINVTGEAFLDPLFNTSIGVSIIPVPLPR